MLARCRMASRTGSQWRSSQPRVVRTGSLRTQSARHRVDHGTICGRSCANSDTVSHCAPVLIAQNSSRRRPWAGPNFFSPSVSRPVGDANRRMYRSVLPSRAAISAKEVTRLPSSSDFKLGADSGACKDALHSAEVFAPTDPDQTIRVASSRGCPPHHIRWQRRRSWLIGRLHRSESWGSKKAPPHGRGQALVKCCLQVSDRERRR